MPPLVSPEGADGGHCGHPGGGGGGGLHHPLPVPVPVPGPPQSPVPAPGPPIGGHHLCQLGAVQLRRLGLEYLQNNVSGRTKITNIYSFTTICLVPGELLIFIASHTFRLRNISDKDYCNCTATSNVYCIRFLESQVIN